MSDKTIQHIATVLPISSNTLRKGTKYRRRRSILKEFSLNTSTHGIPGIARSRSIANRLYWSVLFTSFVGIMVFFVVKDINTYLQYQTHTVVARKFHWPLEFPAVTICNYSPLRLDRFVRPFLQYINVLNQTNTTNRTYILPNEVRHIFSFLHEHLIRNQYSKDLYYPLQDMLISCKYNSIACNVTNFTEIAVKEYGLCYTYNSKRKNMYNGGIVYSSDGGGPGELNLELYVHHHQYIPYLSNGS
jgi:hypothetical protein